MDRKTGFAVTAVLLLIGLSSLGYAGVVLNNTNVSKWGQEPHWLQFTDESPIDSVPDDASVVAYSDLPVEGKRAFDNARQNRQYTLWSDDDSAVIQTLDQHDYIRYRGEYFGYGLSHGHQGWGTIGAILILSILIGGLFTVAGVNRLRRHLSERTTSSH